MEVYNKTQIGTLIIVTFLIAIAALLYIPTPQLKESLWILILGLILVLLLFYSLTIRITPQHFEFSLGIGIIRKKIPIDEIAYCNPVKNSVFTGWGIRKIPGGWLYNMTGLWAVELTLKNGKIIRVGSPEPVEICKILSQLKSSGSLSVE